MLHRLSRYRLVWRLIAPTLGLSVLLLMMGAVSAWYVHRSNVRAAERLDEEIKAVFDAEELLLAVRDVRRQLERYEATEDVNFLNAAIASERTFQERLTAARHGAKTGAAEGEPRQDDEAHLLLLAMDEGQRRCFARLSSLPHPASSVEVEKLRQELTSKLLEPARHLLNHRRSSTRQGSLRSLEVADQLGMGLLALGFSGAFAGLLAGVAIARGLMKSLEQLGVSVRQILGTLETDQPATSLALATTTSTAAALQDDREDDPLPRLRDSLRTAMARSASVVHELQKARRMSERSDQLAAVGQLAAGLAHEIRNPLTSMKLLAQAAQERDRPLSGDDLRILEEEISRLEQLLQTFLDFARPSRLKIERLEVGGLIERTVDLARRRADRQEIALRFETPRVPVFLEADATQLRQVVLNLLLNALDAQREGGQVTVTLAMETAKSGSPEVVIRVQDEGPGIPWGWDEKIFEAFASTKETGIGLGLTICRRIIGSHGGTIEARSREGRGAEFEVRLPGIAPPDRSSVPRPLTETTGAEN